VIEWWTSAYVFPVVVTPFPGLTAASADDARELKVA
jgi:hypothetical protein